MNYTVVGKGKPVILVHGSMSYDPWCDMEYELAKDYKLYLLDLPGFGASETVKRVVHDTDLFSEALDAFIKHTKLFDAPTVGFSLGAVAAIKSATRGYLKGKIILIGLPGNINNKKLRIASLLPLQIRRAAALTSIGRRKILIPIFKDVIGIKDSKRDGILFDAMLSTSVNSLTDINMYERPENQVKNLLCYVKNETVFIYGSHDKLLYTTKNIVKNPIIIQNADHVVFSSQPAETLKIIKNQLDVL